MLFCLLACLSCKEVTFENPQPEGKKNLTTIPRQLHGRFLSVEGDGEPSKDTIIIGEKGYRFGYYDSADRVKEGDPYEMGMLSDSLVLKNYKGYYFFNVKSRSGWLLRVLRRERNGNLTYLDMGKEGIGFQDYLNQLALEVKIDSFMVDNDMVYRIDPTPSELVALIKRGFFAMEIKLLRID